MPIYWEPMLLFPLLALLIPVAILIGQRWRGGPLVSLSVGAMLGMIIYLTLTMSSFTADYYHIYDNSTVETLSLLGSGILLLGALALVFAAALRERRRGWAFIQCALVYGSLVGMLGFFVAPIRYCGDALRPSCSPPDVGRFALFAALMLTGPLATLLYALLAQGRAAPAPDRELEQPEGLSISRLTAEER